MDKNAVIYVAGGNGVAGSAIVRALEEKGYQHILTPTHGQLDLLNQTDVERFFAENRPEYVFFTAVKMGSIVYRNEHPVEILNDNMLMQLYVLKAAHDTGVKKLLFMSSDFVYPNTDSGVMKESDFLSAAPAQKDLPYTLAKMTGIKLCDYYRQEFGDNFFTVVPCAFFGKNASFDLQRANVVGALIKRFYDAKKNGDPELVLWGSGKPVKEFLYSDDIADACLYLMEHYDEGGMVNIGSGDGGITIMDAAKVIAKTIGYSGEITCDLTKPDGIMRRVMDSEKLRSLGWKPRYTFEEGIQETYQHFLGTEHA